MSEIRPPAGPPPQPVHSSPAPDDGYGQPQAAARRRRSRWTIGIAFLVVLLAAAAAAIALSTKNTMLSHTAVERAIAAQYAAASDVSCNGGKNVAMKNGATFTCTATDGEAFLVTIKNRGDGTYQVVRTFPPTAPAAGPSPTPTSPAAVSAASSAPPAQHTSAAPGTTQVDACPDGLIVVSVYQQPTVLNAGSGLVLEFSLPKSSSTASCSLFGYPGVDAYFKCPPDCFTADAVHAVRTPRGPFGGLPSGSTSPSTVVVSSQQPAFAVVDGPGPNAPGVVCQQYNKLLVTPPNTTTSVQLPLNPVLMACDVDVHPVTTHPAGNG